MRCELVITSHERTVRRHGKNGLFAAPNYGHRNLLVERDTLGEQVKVFHRQIGVVRSRTQVALDVRQPVRKRELLLIRHGVQVEYMFFHNFAPKKMMVAAKGGPVSQPPDARLQSWTRLTPSRCKAAETH